MAGYDYRAKLIREWKNKPCVRCKQGYHYSQMDCHSVEEKHSMAKKERGMQSITQIAVLKEELKKCVPMCKNCHALEHWEMRQS